MAVDQVLPYNIEAEDSTLGSMILDRDAIIKAGEILRPQDFYRNASQEIYKALWTLAERDEAVDLITVQEELRKRETLEDVGGMEYLMSLIDSVPSAANVEYYAKIVKAKAVARRGIEACYQTIGTLQAPDSDPDQVLSAHAESICKIAEEGSDTEYFTYNEIGQRVWHETSEAHAAGTPIRGLPTGLVSVDNLLG